MKYSMRILVGPYFSVPWMTRRKLKCEVIEVDSSKYIYCNEDAIEKLGLSLFDAEYLDAGGEVISKVEEKSTDVIEELEVVEEIVVKRDLESEIDDLKQSFAILKIRVNKVIEEVTSIPDNLKTELGSVSDVLKSQIIHAVAPLKGTLSGLRSRVEQVEEDSEEADDRIGRVVDSINSRDDNLDSILKDMKRLKHLDKKVESVIEIVSDRIIRDDELDPKVLSKNFTIKNIWKNNVNSRDAALFTIVYLMKKQLEDSGKRIE